LRGLEPMPCPALPCPALPCPALPCPALPCRRPDADPTDRPTDDDDGLILQIHRLINNFIPQINR
jgi:hypothetical protein